MKNIIFISLIVLGGIAWSANMGDRSKKHSDPHSMYLSDIKPIMETKCAPCHIPSKGGFKTSFESYDSAAKYISDMIVRVQLDSTDAKFMPFRRKRPSLSESEINSLKAWRDSLGGSGK